MTHTDQLARTHYADVQVRAADLRASDILRVRHAWWPVLDVVTDLAAVARITETDSLAAVPAHAWKAPKGQLSTGSPLTFEHAWEHADGRGIGPAGYALAFGDTYVAVHVLDLDNSRPQVLATAWIVWARHDLVTVQHTVS